MQLRVFRLHSLAIMLKLWQFLRLIWVVLLSGNLSDTLAEETDLLLLRSLIILALFELPSKFDESLLRIIT